MGNDRKAGRKRKFDPQTIEHIMEKYRRGHSVSELAGEFGVSRQTMSFYIHDAACEMEVHKEDGITAMVREYTYWKKLNRVFDLSKDDMEDYPLRMDYMWRDLVNTSILVSFKREQILIKNHTDHPLKCAFGIKRNPSWEDFLFFLEDRCVPKTRDHMKVILRDYGLDCYDPISIIEKTGGCMAGDDYHIRMYSLEVPHECV